jgi:hypothetical protein
MEWARDIGGARGLVVDLDLRCPRLKGEVFRGRYGIVGGETVGDRGEFRSGSVALRKAGSFQGTLPSPFRMSWREDSGSRRVGTGEALNSSILSVSGTGSMAAALGCHESLELESGAVCIQQPVECRVEQQKTSRDPPAGGQEGGWEKALNTLQAPPSVYITDPASTSRAEPARRAERRSAAAAEVVSRGEAVPLSAPAEQCV